MARISDLQNDLSGRNMMSQGNVSAKDAYTVPISQPQAAQPQAAAGPVSPIPASIKQISAKADLQQGMMMQQQMQTPYSQPYSPAAFMQPGFQGAPMAPTPMQVPTYAAMDGCNIPPPQHQMSPAMQMQLMQQQKLAQIQAAKQQQQYQAPKKAVSQDWECTPSGTKWSSIVMLVLFIVLLLFVILIFSYLMQSRKEFGRFIMSMRQPLGSSIG